MSRHTYILALHVCLRHRMLEGKIADRKKAKNLIRVLVVQDLTAKRLPGRVCWEEQSDNLSVAQSMWCSQLGLLTVSSARHWSARNDRDYRWQCVSRRLNSTALGLRQPLRAYYERSPLQTLTLMENANPSTNGFGGTATVSAPSQHHQTDRPAVTERLTRREDTWEDKVQHCFDSFISW